MCIWLPVVLDKRGVSTSRRLGPYSRVFTRENAPSWLVVGSPLLYTTSEYLKQNKKVNTACEN